ncbi:MAG: hypothetical protein HOI95_14960 [Chromatiales bacterium]|jgi:tellurite resistance protein|nr:hypothetical protein [Chromatiales bacterium]
MDNDTKRALFINAVLVANADGVIQPEERMFLKRMIGSMALPNAHVQQWLREARKADLGLEPIHDRQAAEMVLRAMIGTAAADRQLHGAERQLLISWAKTNNFSASELADLLREHWNGPTQKELMQGASGSAGSIREQHRGVLVGEGFDDVEALMTTSPELELQLRNIEQALNAAEKYQFVVFHADEDKALSLRMLRRLADVFDKRPIVVVMERHQAFQVSYLLEEKPCGCIITPVYEGELYRRVVQLDADISSAAPRSP